MPEAVGAMAMAPVPSKGRQRLNKAVGGSAAAALLISLVAGFEGKRNDPYRDIVNRATVCYGETRVQMRRYSDAECDDMLADGLADFAAPVLKRNPELAGHPAQVAAMTSFSYNVGIGSYNRSSTARFLTEGQWVSACNSLRRWVYAGGKKVQGLVNRREAERALCLRDIPADRAR